MKIDATGRLTLRNRKFLHQFTPPGKDILIGIAPPSSHIIDVEPPSVPITNSDEDKVIQDTKNVDKTITEVDVVPPVSDPEDIHRTDDDCNIPTSRLSMDTHFVRRSSRLQKPTQVYDANSGSYVPTQR